MTDRPKLPLGMCYMEDLPVEPLPESPPFAFVPVRPDYGSISIPTNKMPEQAEE